MARKLINRENNYWKTAFDEQRIAQETLADQQKTPEEQDLTNSGKRDATAGEQRTTGKRSWWTDTQKTAIMKDNWNMSWMDWKNKKLPFSEQWTVEKQKTMNGELQENRGNEQIATGN